MARAVAARGVVRLGPAAGLALALAPVLAACGAGTNGSLAAGVTATDRTGTVVESGADCLSPQVLTALGFDPARTAISTTHPAAPEAGTLPESFVPVSAVLCSTGETLTDDAGRWAAVSASRLEGDITSLVDALREIEADDGSPTSGTSCAAGAVRSDLWLVDALGAAVRVELPDGGCGALPTAVRSGLSTLEEVDLELYPVELVAPAPSTTPTTTR